MHIQRLTVFYSNDSEFNFSHIIMLIFGGSPPPAPPPRKFIPAPTPRKPTIQKNKNFNHSPSQKYFQNLALPKFYSCFMVFCSKYCKIVEYMEIEEVAG